MFEKITEQESLYNDLELKSISELTSIINEEDKKVAIAVSKCLEKINPFVELLFSKMQQGGRLFYIGAGTSGRLGILDASECPPTFGVDHDWVIGIISGGDKAIRIAQEFAEDSQTQAWLDLQKFSINKNDVVLGIAASGTTPYVIGGLKKCQEEKISTASITCNPGSPVAKFADFPIEVIVGPEVLTGSTRMKSGTAQKMILNIISTTVMIKLGRVKGNRMVDMKLSNNKLVDRGTKMIVSQSDLPYDEAQKLLLDLGSVRKVLLHINAD